MISARPVKMSLLRTAWVKLNCPRTGVGGFHLFMRKSGLAPSPNCEFGASEETAVLILIACPIYWTRHGARGLTILDDDT